jgi:hypothetical protein
LNLLSFLRMGGITTHFPLVFFGSTFLVNSIAFYSFLSFRAFRTLWHLCPDLLLSSRAFSPSYNFNALEIYCAHFLRRNISLSTLFCRSFSSFLVLVVTTIECVRTFIRPLSLSARLVANISARHLLLDLFYFKYMCKTPCQYHRQIVSLFSVFYLVIEFIFCHYLGLLFVVGYYSNLLLGPLLMWQHQYSDYFI